MLTQGREPGGGLPYKVVVNAWASRDGTADRDEVLEYSDAMGWPRANTVIRQHKIHTRAAAEGEITTQDADNGTTLQTCRPGRSAYARRTCPRGHR
ncbi:hypothetical protein GCM10015535_67230 [Streptomyces gelaticus]|uniref:Uncharacterized protein n=2 Tax=Streptomyces gelaticus TaxID=285446 RepID=A0ABQ2WBC4_9ACTN|nr:hypothetical protein GCM10015535_67230 [Streptomyces gelaticus]